jgi:hypothetical protein
MMGLANSESSHVLWITSVLWPPRSISEVYSSIARLLSPIKIDTGKYILYFHLFLVLLLVRTVDPCHWDNHPHRILKLFIEAKGATRHLRCCNGTNRNRKEEERQLNALVQERCSEVFINLKEKVTTMANAWGG